ncbi:hypothetical protein FQZ97_864130 [compost metagenome]
MRRVHQIFGHGAVKAGQAHRQAGGDAEAGRDRADVHFGVDRRIGRHGDLLHAGHVLERAHEAGRVAGREQLLGVGGGAGAAHGLGRGELDVEQAVVGSRGAFTAAGGVGAGGVDHFVEGGGHGGSFEGGCFSEAG